MAASLLDLQYLQQPQPPNTYFFLYDSFLGLKPPVPLAVSLGSAVLYLLCTYVIWPSMRGIVKTYSGFFTLFRTCHNIGLFLYSGLCCSLCFKYMYEQGELNFLGPDGFHPLLCNEKLPKWLWLLSLSFVASKLYEMLDTAFIVWFSAKKGLTFLHVYHHATTFWLFLNVSNFASCAKMGLLLNGFVHTLMYAHYARPFPKPLVPLITIAQIIQLAFVTWVWAVTPLRCPQHASFIDNHIWEYITNFALVPVYLIFFLHFFAQRFIFGGDKRPKPRKTE